ncbi:MAG: glutamate synthase subunit beta [Verrucomicrobia bacterium]|nr:glutamate synthase subunit beta [Verrucomicrobiota bacterium]
MGKPTGFLEINRELPSDASPLERIKHWREFHEHLAEDKLRAQGARCMDCGIPFCHVGRILAGAASGCPINNLIPEWNDLVYRGLWKEALERLLKTNNFPEFTGRVCPAPCEGSCTVGMHLPPVTIKQIECEIIDRAFSEGWVTPQPPKKRTSKNVAVIGSGPAGLAAAAQLNKAGHNVTVFERADRPGGLLMYGIPNMKLDKQEVVLRRIQLMEQEGVTFLLNTEVGRNYPVQELFEDFHAIVLATGASVPRDLTIEGRDLKGIHFAMDFLTANTQHLFDAQVPFINADGKDVVVIGGGDTGTDCVGTSLRHGCKSVTQLEILPQPPLERAADNPWPQWPKVYKLDYGQEEAKAVQGADPRQYLVTANKFLGNGNVTGIEIVQVEWTKTGPKPIPGTEKTIPAQLVLLAMGFLGPEVGLLKALNIQQDERANIKAEYGKFATSLRGVFAAGDCRRGQSLVVWAINEGRACAREVDRYLMGNTDLP